VCTGAGGSPSWTTTGLSYEKGSPATHTIILFLNVPEHLNAQTVLVTG
jgi:hypothetical protein